MKLYYSPFIAAIAMLSQVTNANRNVRGFSNNNLSTKADPANASTFEVRHLTQRIVGGNPAEDGEYRSYGKQHCANTWFGEKSYCMASIHFSSSPILFSYAAVPKTDSFGDGLCGSVKIWGDILLTAGHCIGAFTNKVVYIGGNDRFG